MVVPTRMLTFLLVQLSTTEALPFAMAWSAIPLFVAAMVQLFLLARSYFASEATALATVVFFSLTTCYREVVVWYAATQWLFALNLLLFALLLVELAPPVLFTRRVLAASVVSFLAPFCYSLGLLVGPITSLWTLMREANRQGRWPWLLAALPTAATAASLLVIVPILRRFVGTEEYFEGGGRGVLETFDLPKGIFWTVRLMVDLLVVRNLGGTTVMQVPKASELQTPFWYAVTFPLLPLSVVLLMLCRPTAGKLGSTPLRLAAPLMIVVLPYLLSMPFRTWVQYHELVWWSRYQLLPQLGLALVLGEAVRPWLEAGEASAGRLTKKQAILLAGLAVMMVLLHYDKAMQRG
jgi:hypothetical protein